MQQNKAFIFWWAWVTMNERPTTHGWTLSKLAPSGKFTIQPGKENYRKGQQGLSLFWALLSKISLIMWTLLAFLFIRSFVKVCLTWNKTYLFCGSWSAVQLTLVFGFSDSYSLQVQTKTMIWNWLHKCCWWLLS